MIGAIFLYTSSFAWPNRCFSNSVPPGPANHGKPWTEDLAQQVARAYEQGVSVPQIAEIFQRSPISIYLKLESLGKLTHEQVEVALGRHAGIEAGQHTRH